MAEETETETEVEQQGNDADRHDRHLANVRSDRDKLRSKLKEASSKLAEFEAREAKTAEEKERAAGDWAALEKRYQTQIRGLEEKLEEASGKLDGMVRGQHQARFVDAIMTASGLTNRIVVESLLPRVGLEDDAPAEFTERDVVRAVKGLRGIAPQLFSTSDTTKPPPGSAGKPIDKNSPEYWRDLAARSSGDNVSSAYLVATGRAKG